MSKLLKQPKPLKSRKGSFRVRGGEFTTNPGGGGGMSGGGGGESRIKSRVVEGSIMSIAQKLLQLTKKMSEEAKKDKIDPVLPPFFEEPGKPKKGKYDVDDAPDPGKKPKGKKKLPDGAEELEYGVSGIDVLADAAEEGSAEHERITVEFRDQRQLEDAYRVLGEDPEIGTPTYELGTDGKSLVFHPWKADDSMKDRIKAAVKRLVDDGIAIVRDKSAYQKPGR